MPNERCCGNNTNTNARGSLGGARYAKNAIPAIIAQVGVIIATVCAYPLMMWPVIERIEPIIFGPDTQYVETKRNLFRMGLVLLSFGLAASIPMFGTTKTRALSLSLSR